MRTACIIPAYNESEHIAGVIAGLRPFVDDIIIVDDASSDDTRKIVAGQEGVRLIPHIINRGQGAALRTGTQAALKMGADIIVHFDADGQFRAQDIPDLIAPIVKGEADAVLGSRFLGLESDMPAFKRFVIMPLARLVNRLLLGIRLTDPQSGFRALSRAAALRLRIENDRMAHCSEIIYRLFKNKERVREVPIRVLYTGFGQKFSGGLRIIRDLIIQKLID